MGPGVACRLGRAALKERPWKSSGAGAQHWRSEMSKSIFAFVAMLLASAIVGARPVQAAPPTVTPSPGYDARLQEQRKATSASSRAVAQPAAPLVTSVTSHRSKRKH
jgi:hypothetical protein